MLVGIAAVAPGCNAIFGIERGMLDAGAVLSSDGATTTDVQQPDGSGAEVQDGAGDCCPAVLTGLHIRQAVCTRGKCTIECNSGYEDCDGSYATGCENLNTRSYCGSCSNACKGMEYCTASSSGSKVCALTCAPGLVACAENGGCADFAAATTCGSCANDCTKRPALPHSTPTCASGTCGFSCDAGYMNCNGMAADGCEQAENVHQCGSGCVDCSGATVVTASCTGGACDYDMCAVGYGECNGIKIDGCEDCMAVVCADYLPCH